MYELTLTCDDVPKNFKEDIMKPEWLKAMTSEIESIGKSKTRKLVPLPKHAKPIGQKWLFKIKRNVDGSISRYKAQIVAKGYVQEYGIDFDEVFVPVDNTIIDCSCGREWMEDLPLRCEDGLLTRRIERRSVHPSDVAVLWNPFIRKVIVVVVPFPELKSLGHIIGFWVCQNTCQPKLVRFTNIRDARSIDNIHWQVKLFILNDEGGNG
ncbi:hypothetical protein OSB04_028530 [Centaurea solstitialis]|uniref:Reverse transcriptase Ty1/copia-type domain-containing protein n=1 Tax=Centaurea solstitialis TaxID=347529 RepID=A0AA38SFR4_9ASTR|nr:hypothetical protein OSB04_028530 [Centaurea solstitialis]